MDQDEEDIYPTIDNLNVDDQAISMYLMKENLNSRSASTNKIKEGTAVTDEQDKRLTRNQAELNELD